MLTEKEKSASSNSIILSDKEIDYFTYICSIMQRTRGARFGASQLLIIKERASLFSLSVLSVILISTSVYLIALPSSVVSDQTQRIGVVSVIASVAILVISIFDYALGRGLSAAKLHENALIITRIMRGIERELLKSDPDKSLLYSLASDYEQLNIETSINHTSFDASLYDVSRMSSDNIAINAMMRLIYHSMRWTAVIFSVSPGVAALFGVVWWLNRIGFLSF